MNIYKNIPKEQIDYLKDITGKYEKEHRYCVICNEPAEPHEIVARGINGCLCEENRVWLCRIHHTECESSVGFVRKYGLEVWWIEAWEHRRERRNGKTDCSK